jgi:hypothetical protein
VCGAQAQKQIFNVMKFDSYPRFLRSGVHAECARADLCGLPPPYAPPDAANANATPKVRPTHDSSPPKRPLVRVYSYIHTEEISL